LRFAPSNQFSTMIGSSRASDRQGRSMTKCWSSGATSYARFRSCRRRNARPLQRLSPQGWGRGPEKPRQATLGLRLSISRLAAPGTGDVDGRVDVVEPAAASCWFTWRSAATRGGGGPGGGAAGAADGDGGAGRPPLQATAPPLVRRADWEAGELSVALGCHPGAHGQYPLGALGMTVPCDDGQCRSG
jgi:hypothetical protein